MEKNLIKELDSNLIVDDIEKKEKKFEEKMSELEVLVKSLENGDIALDDAIKSFTEAMNLAKDCDKELKDAEKALTEIVSEDGTLKEFKGEVSE